MAHSRYPVVDGKKNCSWCKETKPVAEFYKIRQRGFEYYDSKCNDCRRKYHAKYARKWYAEHPHISRDYSRKWKSENKERSDFLMWRSHVSRKYGLSHEQSAELFANPKCGICETDDPGKGTKRFCVDHCHTTNKVRGLLCHECNRALERVEKFPDWGARALAYLAHALTPANTPRA